MTRWLLAALLTLTACGDGLAFKRRTFIESDLSRRTCLGVEPFSADELTAPGPHPRDLPANTPLTVTARVGDLGGTHMRTEGGCTVELHDHEVRILPHVSYWSVYPQAGPSLGPLDVTCEIPPLPEGDYAVTVNDRTLSIEIPGHVPHACLQAPPPEWPN